MSSAQQPTISPSQLVSVLLRYPVRWLGPALVVTVVVGAYGLVRPATWEASQALIVRNEAATGEARPGKFSHPDERQTVQETILELARSRDVLSAALTEVGPPADRKPRNAWPSARDVAKLRRAVKLAPPKGTEFGTTEVFYLKVRDHSRARAGVLATAIADELKSRFQQLLDDRAASMIRELERTVAVAEDDLEESTGKLSELEGAVGSELAELRILNESPAGNSDLRQKVVEVDNECRKAKADRRAKAELLSLLRACKSDHGQLLALPDRLLESYATLRRLIEGLAVARLTTCSLEGKMSQAHPLVRAAKAEEKEIVGKISRECDNAIQIAETELRLADARVTSLEDQLADLRARFECLGGLRAQYANAVARAKNHTALLETAQHTLADARASQAAARAASLIDSIGSPDTGADPVGPSRAMIVLAGLVGGLLVGFGVMFLTVDPATEINHDEPTVAVPINEVPWKRNGHNGTARSNGRPVGGLSLQQALARVSPWLGHVASDSHCG